jgi:predicted CoA-binding protein
MNPRRFTLFDRKGLQGIMENRERPYDQLDRIFHPRRLAVVGVSGDNIGFGSRTILTLQQFGYPGEICPVNPKGGTIAGPEHL